MTIHSTIEELQEAIYFASLDAKPRTWKATLGPN